MKQLSFSIILLSFLTAQIGPPAALQSVTPRVFALTNGIFHVEPGRKIDEGVILLRDGFIEAVGPRVDIPADATVIDLKGGHVYAGFIDGWYEVKTDDIARTAQSHWIDLVHPEWVSADLFQPEKKELEALRSMGFTTVLTVPDKGIFRGRASLMSLSDTHPALDPNVAQVMDFQTRGWDAKDYPGALLGTIAVMRQTFYDADWYDKAQAVYHKYPEQNEPVPVNNALAAVGKDKSLARPFYFRTTSEIAALRAIHLSREFNLDLWLLGSGFEYQRLKEITQVNPFIVIPLNFPGKPDVADPYRALQYQTDQLLHWDLAPDNPARLTERGIPLGLTTYGLKDKKQFRKNIALATQRGWTEKSALAALTTQPAQAMGKKEILGKIAKGYQANLVVVDGNYFTADAPVRAVWIAGVEYPIEPEPDRPASGSWEFHLFDQTATLTIGGKFPKLTFTFTYDSTGIKAHNLAVSGRRISWTIEAEEYGFHGVTQFVGHFTPHSLTGTAYYSDGDELPFTAQWQSKTKNTQDKEPRVTPSDLTITYPLGAFGLPQPPDQPHAILINDVTLWTCSDQGILKDWDMLIQDGVITRIAPDIRIPRGSALVIDGREKHITPGLIDAHSHTASASINEGTQSVTAEVRIQDVLNPDDISLYRQLAGGLTILNSLHGSANVIGGQNAVLKLRWGATAEGLIYEKAPPGIKFALGENVKQSNWGDDFRTRYPQTRMGVEQVLRDAFTRALNYEKNWRAYRKSTKLQKTKVPPRRDLELDALVEVLHDKRLVHCHSYRQDEILMLTRVAEDFGFTIDIFQHVLEGYKVADRMAAHGAGGSTFTDWWAYKFEVYDAIPYNGKLMQDAGVVVSFNSDSNELARRLNLEAAKGVKYSGMTEEEALKTVTLNPAIQLGIDEYVGSLEVGKDADFVVWSGHPLSTRTVCEETWIDGQQYFSRKKNEELLARDTDLRRRLIQKILHTEDDDNPAMEPAPVNPEDDHSCLGHDRITWEGAGQ